MDEFIYLDSCVILSFLKDEPDRADRVRDCLSNAQAGIIPARLITSVMTIAEVSWVISEESGDVLPLQVIDDFWNDAPIHFYEVNTAHAHRARDLMRNRLSAPRPNPDFNIRRRSIDVLHLATAITIGAKAFWTFDVKDFQNYQADGIEIMEPEPVQPTLL